MTIRRLMLAAIFVALAVTLWAYRTAVADPVVREATVPLLPKGSGTQPIRAVLISDIHVAGPDMPPERLGRIVAQINALQPDLILMAGDFVSDKRVATRQYTMAQAIAPLGGLRSAMGSYAVLGNHDHWRDAAEARRALVRFGITLLNNSAVRAGPLAIGGLDDAYTGHADTDATVSALRRIGGVPLVISHSPDPFPRMPADIRLMVAGHTHCGQIRLPLIGAISYMSEYDDRYACGRIVERGRTLIVGAGVGTSILPLRLGAVPDMWLITLTPTAR